MNSGCGKVLGDFARNVLHHHRAVADPDHAIFGNEHGTDPRTTMRYERARTSLDRHAPYIVAAFAGVPRSERS